MTMTTGSRPSCDINVTPMIDILLVLLIIFMAITPVPPKGLEALLPRPPKSDSAPAPEAVVLQIVRMNGGEIAYKINQASIVRDEIRGRLQHIFSTRPAKVMFVEADKDLDFSPVAWSIDVARSAGVDHIGLVTPGTTGSR
jgi:biopolymer transport protein ExbD